MENPDTYGSDQAKEPKRAQRKGFRGGGSDEGPPQPPWALLLLLMASILAVILGAYAWASRVEHG